MLSGSTVRKKYDFRWDVLEGIIGGRSLIDSTVGLTGFPMQNQGDVDRFLKSYGYDLENPIEKAEITGNFHEAINFIRKYFLQPENPDGLKVEIPRKILELTDIRDLLLMACDSYPGQTTDTQGKLRKQWACSLLKVMHAVSHIDNDLRASYFTDIQKQIFDRFYKVIHRDEKEQLYLGENPEDPLRVNLVVFETKPKKSRDSILLKLLHKAETAAEDIFDQVGIRFVTQTKLEALRIIKYLKDEMIVMPANIKPSRSRNSLLDLQQLKQDLESVLQQAEKGRYDEESFKVQLETLINVPGSDTPNPHTSRFYRAIQFTGRHLIKLRNPAYEDLKSLKALTKKKSIDEDVSRLIDNIDMQYLQREIRFFYPYEVQVMDLASFEENEAGLSAHSEYKKAQVQTALKRVMGNLMDVIR